MTTKHTPGPWTIGRLPVPGKPVTHSNVAYGLLNIKVSDPAQAEANARLMAAAPDLLAVVQAALRSGVLPRALEVQAADAIDRAVQS